MPAIWDKWWIAAWRLTAWDSRFSTSPTMIIQSKKPAKNCVPNSTQEFRSLKTTDPRKPSILTLKLSGCQASSQLTAGEII